MSSERGHDALVERELLTGNGADHGQSCKGPCQPLPTHDGCCIAGRQEPCQSKEATLEDGTKGCKDRDIQKLGDR